MSLIEKEKEDQKQGPQNSMFHAGGALYMTGGIPQYPMQAPIYQNMPPMYQNMPQTHTLPGIHPESVFTTNAPPMQTQPPALCSMQPVQMVQAGAFPNAPCFFVQ
jgi:hypothetical protein